MTELDVAIRELQLYRDAGGKSFINVSGGSPAGTPTTSSSPAKPPESTSSPPPAGMSLLAMNSPICAERSKY